MAGYDLKMKHLIKPDLQKLIKHLTKFNEDDPEFKKCENFALSHILHHSYLSVNRHQVQRSINGIVNKFSVHGFDNKAKHLEKTVERFVKSDHFKDHEEVDIVWSILLLLMDLSNNPMSQEFQESMYEFSSFPASPKSENCSNEQEFDWGKYLKEGCKQFELGIEEEDSSWSDMETDEDDEVEPETIKQIQDPNYALSKVDMVLWQEPRETPVDAVYQSYSFIQKNLNEKSFDRDKPLKSYDDRLISENWMKQSLQYDWWNYPFTRFIPNSSYLSAKLAILWEQFEHDQTQGVIPLGRTSIISEYKVIREVLWILQAPGSTFVFDVNNVGEVKAKENISIPSLISESLAAFLNENVCVYANIVNELLQFIEDVNKEKSIEKKAPYTYQAYANALNKHISDFFSDVVTLEHNVDKQEVTFTLVSVIEELRPSLCKLEYIYKLHKAATYDFSKCEGWFSSIRLLATLYEDLYTNYNYDYLIIALDLFIKSFRVYLQIIDVWLSEGRLEDWRDEFIIKRFEDEQKVVSYVDVLKEINKTHILQILQEVEKAGSDLEHIRKLGEITALSMKVTNKGFLYKDFVAKLGNTLDKFISDQNSDDISEENISEPNRNSPVTEHSKSRVFGNSNESLNNITMRLSIPAKKPVFGLAADEMNSVWTEMATETLLDTQWLKMVFKDSDKFKQKKGENIFSDVLNKITTINAGPLPLYNIIERTLIDLFNKRQCIASNIMLDTLLNKFKLQLHLGLLRSIYILEASYIIQRFYNRLFSIAVLPNSIQKAEYSLNVLLEECIESIIPHDLANRCEFSVNFTNDEKEIDSENIIDSINIDYKVDLPISLVITKESLNIYNSVFKFLLKIEWALTSLHQLRFSDIKETEINQSRVRLLYKLRMFLMHCFTTLHSYFIAYYPRELKMQLETSISVASTVKEVKNAHDSYLNKLKKHCLLDRGNNIMKTVKKLLGVCKELCNCWHKESEAKLTSEELNHLEDKYTKSHVCLHIFLKFTVGDHSNASLRLLSDDIERSLPVPAVTFISKDNKVK